jgi:hypothetical protein
MISSLSLLHSRQKEHPFPRLAEVVGSNPTRSTFICVRNTVLFQVQFRLLSDKPRSTVLETNDWQLMIERS